MSTKHIPSVTVSLLILVATTSHPSTFYLTILPYQSIQYSLNQNEAIWKIQDCSRNICGEILWLLQEWIEGYKGYQKFFCSIFPFETCLQ